MLQILKMECIRRMKQECKQKCTASICTAVQMKIKKNRFIAGDYGNGIKETQKNVLRRGWIRVWCRNFKLWLCLKSDKLFYLKFFLPYTIRQGLPVTRTAAHPKNKLGPLVIAHWLDSKRCFSARSFWIPWIRNSFWDFRLKRRLSTIKRLHCSLHRF